MAIPVKVETLSFGFAMVLIEILNEPIKVRADFVGGMIRPLSFKRKRQVFRIGQVNARWEDRQAQHKCYFFAVEAEGNIFELHLDSGEMTWYLDRVCLEG